MTVFISNMQIEIKYKTKYNVKIQKHEVKVNKNIELHE